MKQVSLISRVLISGACALPIVSAAAQPVPAPLPPPRTANGESAPPLRVPPPPELLPVVTPSLPAGVNQGLPAGPITIDQAVTIGLQRQPTVGLAQQSARVAAGRTRQATSQLLPSVSVSTGYANTAATVGGSPTNIFTTTGVGGFNTGLSARQLVFDFGHTLFNVQASRQLEAAARAGELTARQNIAFDIRQNFFTLLENARLAEVDQQTVAAQRAHLLEARARWSAGRAPESDVVTAQTNLANALETLALAQNAVAISRSNLDITMGIDARTPIQIVDVNPTPVTLQDLNALVTRAQGARPEVVQAQRQLAATQADLRSAQTSNLPAVVATGTYGYRGSTFPGSNGNRSLGLSLAWDVFDSGLTSGRITEARANVESARLQLFQAQQGVSQDVTQAYLNVNNAQQRLITSDAEVANALESVRLALGRYRAGVAIFLEVTDAQAALATAQANRVVAAYGLDISLAQLDRAVGRTV